MARSSSHRLLWSNVLPSTTGCSRRWASAIIRSIGTDQSMLNQGYMSDWLQELASVHLGAGLCGMTIVDGSGCSIQARSTSIGTVGMSSTILGSGLVVAEQGMNIDVI